jgi:hypothetical protein
MNVPRLKALFRDLASRYNAIADALEEPGDIGNQPGRDDDFGMPAPARRPVQKAQAAAPEPVVKPRPQARPVAPVRPEPEETDMGGEEGEVLEPTADEAELTPGVTREKVAESIIGILDDIFEGEDVKLQRAVEKLLAEFNVGDSDDIRTLSAERMSALNVRLVQVLDKFSGEGA